MAALDATPVDGLTASLRQRGPDQAADQGLCGTSREATAPCRQVPRHGGGQSSTDHLVSGSRCHAHDPADRVRHRRPNQQRAKQIEDNDTDDDHECGLDRLTDRTSFQTCVAGGSRPWNR